MKKLTIFVLSGVLVFGAAACTTSKTSADAPNTTQESPQARNPDDVKAAQQDAQSQTRRDQLNSNIRAREQRTNVATGGDANNRADSDLRSEVQSKLEANIPASALTVASDKGSVTVSGTVPKQEQLAKIEPLAKQIKGVKDVKVTATVGEAKAQ